MTEFYWVRRREGGRGMIRNEKGKTSLGKGKGEKEMGKVDMRIY